ncbi:MAG: PRTRC system protein C [Verrucomicrobiota bacterium]
MEASAITRVFVYNGTKLPDPNPSASVDQVRDILSANYAEIANAAIDGPKINGSEHTYTFVRSVGEKG